MPYLHTYYVTKREWTKILSHTIRWFQGTEYDHAGFGLSNDVEPPMKIQEATLKGVVETDYAEFIGKHSYVVHEFRIPITQEQYNSILKLILENRGKEYSLAQLVGNAFAICAKKCFNYIMKKNPFMNGWKKLTCSEYLGKALVLVGGTLPDGFDFESINITHCLEINKNMEKAIRMK